MTEMSGTKVHENFCHVNKNFWYKAADRFIPIKPCNMDIVDVLKDHMSTH